MIRKLIFLTIFLSPGLLLFSQGKTIPVSTQKLKPVYSDCKSALKIVLDKTVIYGPTVEPLGFGSLQEIKGNNLQIFEEEHNSAWYLLSIQKSGKLAFEITPTDTTNDYDFLLYTYTDSSFCDAFYNDRVKPIRSNLSNVKRSIRGITGLAVKESLRNSIGKGIGDAYSEALNVKAGEKYMLVLDNVTPEGKGHTIEFVFLKSVIIKGQ